MKALTLTQPWASLVAIGAKRIETRSWRTPYRGPLAIHAAKGFPADARDFANCRMVSGILLKETLGNAIDGRFNNVLPLGAVIATCRLISCIPTREIEVGKVIETDAIANTEEYRITEQEWALGNYDPGRWAWLLADVKLLPEPVPAKGALSLWDWNERTGGVIVAKEKYTDSERLNALEAAVQEESLTLWDGLRGHPAKRGLSLRGPKQSLRQAIDECFLDNATRKEQAK